MGFMEASFMLILKLSMASLKLFMASLKLFMARLILGFAFGVAMVFGFAFLMQTRSNQRIAKAADVKLLGELTQDDLKKLFRRNRPLWISFPEFERVRWLNKLLDKVWPSVAKAAGAVIKESLEPILESYRPIGISQLKFKELLLGNVAPQIEGIRMQSLEKGQVTMDLEFRWGGDPSIVLGVYTMIGAVLPVQLKDFKFSATVRVIFVLSEEMPFISAIVVALLAKPKPSIKYIFKVIHGSLTAVPGLSDMIRDLVEDIVIDQLQWPHRIIIPLSADPGILSDLETKLQGKVTCTVVKAESLKNPKDNIFMADPYVILYVRPLFKCKTQVINKNLNPQYDETFDLNVEDYETQVLHFKVVDEDHDMYMGNAKILGLASFPMSELVPEQKQTLRLPLLPSLHNDLVRDKEDRGTLHIELLYHEYTQEECAQAMELEKVELKKQELAEVERKKELEVSGLREGLCRAGVLCVGGVVLGGSEIVRGLVGGTRMLAEGSKVEAAGMLVRGIGKGAGQFVHCVTLGVADLGLGATSSVKRFAGLENSFGEESQLEEARE